MGKKTLDKIQKGIKLAYLRMLEDKARNDDYIVVSDGGKILRLKAKKVLADLKRKRKI